MSGFHKLSEVSVSGLGDTGPGHAHTPVSMEDSITQGKMSLKT